MNSTDQTQRHRPNTKKGSCPNCNRKSSKFASLLGRHFDYGRSCPNCRPKEMHGAIPNIQHSTSMPPSNIPSTLVVPSSSYHEADWIEDDHQDDNMTIISEITMDRALLEQKRPNLRPSVESSQQVSSSSSMFTPTTHLMAQDFTKSMDTLTEESFDKFIQRSKHALSEEVASGKRISNESSKTIDYSLDKIDRFDNRIQLYQKRGYSRSPPRSLPPPPNNTTMYNRAPSQEERLSRSYNGEGLYHEPTNTQYQPQKQLSSETSDESKSTSQIDSQAAPTSISTKKSVIKDIPIVLKCVEMYPTKNCIERAFQTLFLLSTEADPMGRLARKEIVNLRGFDLLHDSLRRHEKDAESVIAAFNALWALCFFNGSDEEAKCTAVQKVQELNIIESVICALESHSKNVEVQEIGFDLINRFLDLLPPDQLKPAIGTILRNVDHINVNTQAYAIGIDTLNCLCQQFDDSKLQVANNFVTNTIILERLIDRSTCIESQELICQLLWCVTSITESVSVLSSNSESIMKNIILVMEEVPRSDDTALLHESTCGILANLAMLEANYALMEKLGVISLICEEIYAFDHSEYVLSAACTALANLLVSAEIRAVLLAEDGVTALLFSMKSAPDNLEVQCEAMRALNKLTESPKAFASGINIIISTIICYSDNKCIQRIGCSIINKLSVNEKCRVSLIGSRVFDALIQIQKLNVPSKSIQNDIISLLRNLSFEESVIPTILNRGFVEMSVKALEAHSSYAELQENGCDLFWKLASFSHEAKLQICSNRGVISAVIQAMQMIPESASLQEIACKALHATIQGSDEQKKIAITQGIIDTIICLILVHPHDAKVLDEAVNILTCLSTVEGCLSQIADNGGIIAVIDAMHSNDSSVDLIIASVRFIRRAVLEDEELANNVTDSVPAILSCMNKHPESTELLVISCEALKCLVTKSETCKKHLLASQGRSILEKIVAEKKYKDVMGSSSATISIHSLLDELC